MPSVVIPDIPNPRNKEEAPKKYRAVSVSPLTTLSPSSELKFKEYDQIKYHEIFFYIKKAVPFL